MAKVAYKLGKNFWNGKKLIERGETYYFEEGEAPKSATLAKEEPAPAKPVAKPADKGDK